VGLAGGRVAVAVVAVDGRLSPPEIQYRQQRQPLRARLMHGKRYWSVLTERRLLWKRIRLCLRKRHEGKHI
jgi:hypothetical protein